MDSTWEHAVNRHRISLHGDVGIAQAAGFKARLLDWAASDDDLELDLAKVESIDITILQLLCAAGCAAAEKGHGIRATVSEAACLAAADAGFVLPWLGDAHE